MAKTLSFDTGVVEYDLNGAAKVRFNPTDSAFVERLYRAFDELDGKQGEFQQHIADIGDDGGKLFAYANERDAEMRSIIDSLLGEGTADALFPDMNCYAIADGLPVWINLMFAICDEIDAAFSAEQKRSDPRVRKYSKKYDAMMAKYSKKAGK